MSGRLYVPPAFANINVLSDPYAIMWEIKFVKAFVEHFKGHKAIGAWELGNECNCMAINSSREEAYLWASAIRDAVVSVDDTRPFVSGMHSVQVYANERPNVIEDQGEICDFLTTHPYPLFTPHCSLDPVNEMKNGLHATAESRLYADVSGKPCIVEEIGTLGPMICSEKIAADYVRMSAMSSLAHDLRTFIWWCAYDQNHLANPPYDWASLERELGIFRKDPRPNRWSRR
jgi:endo-1,4-beta-mannosidase